MRIYVASSWRNYSQPGIVHILRRIGHEVYDFRNPPNNSGFGWEQVNPNLKHHMDSAGRVSPSIWRVMLANHIAKAGYESNKGAIEWCDTIVYLLPCGRSASWEMGYATALRKKLYVVAFEPTEPELMFREAKILISMPEVFDAFGEPKEE